MDKILMPKALTAENGAKALMIGEFKESVIMPCTNCDGDGVFEDGSTCLECGGAGDYQLNVMVSWTTIKEVYAMAVKNLGE